MNHDTLARRVGPLSLLPHRDPVDLADQDAVGGGELAADRRRRPHHRPASPSTATTTALPMPATACPTTTSRATPWCSASRSPTRAARRWSPGTCSQPIALDTDQGPPAGERVRQAGRDRDHDDDPVVHVRQGRRQEGLPARGGAPGDPSRRDHQRAIGEDNLAVQFKLAGHGQQLQQHPGVASPTTSTSDSTRNLNRFVMVDRGVDGVTGGNNPSEQTAALWAWSDANDTATCGSSHPFSGKGWEGNYDSGVMPPEARPHRRSRTSTSTASTATATARRPASS